MSITDEPRTEKQGRVKSPPQPLNEPRRRRGLLLLVKLVIVVGLIGILVITLAVADKSPSVNSAKDIAVAYDHAIILQAREGDTLESAALAVFPNTLIEERVREDKLDDEAKALELARYQAEWQRLARLLTGTTGTTLTAGEFFAVPAKADEPGAIEVGQVPAEIKELTEASERLDDATGG